jgi:hypothetical protein
MQKIHNIWNIAQQTLFSRLFSILLAANRYFFSDFIPVESCRYISFAVLLQSWVTILCSRKTGTFYRSEKYLFGMGGNQKSNPCSGSSSAGSG